MANSVVQFEKLDLSCRLTMVNSALAGIGRLISFAASIDAKTFCTDTTTSDGVRVFVKNGNHPSRILHSCLGDFKVFTPKIRRVGTATGIPSYRSRILDRSKLDISLNHDDILCYFNCVATQDFQELVARLSVKLAWPEDPCLLAEISNFQEQSNLVDKKSCTMIGPFSFRYSQTENSNEKSELELSIVTALDGSFCGMFAHLNYETQTTITESLLLTPIPKISHEIFTT